MNKTKKIIAIIIVLVVVAAGAVGYGFYYDSNNYFKTDNASVSADMINITPLVTGSISSWDVKEGDQVKKGQVLGQQDISSMVSNSDMNTATLKSSADSIQSKAQITTPISGSIIKSYVLQGETVSPGMTVAVVANTSDLYIKANIEETNIFNIKEGQKVKVSIDAYPGKVFDGYVVSTGKATQSTFSAYTSINTSGTYSKVTQLIAVKISIINDENLPLLIGMNATVKISIK